MADESTSPQSETKKADPAELKGRPLGRVLVRLGKVSRQQVHQALDQQQQRRMPIGQLLLEQEAITEDDLNEGLALQAGMDRTDLESVELSEEVIQTLPAETAQAYQCLPIDYDKESNTLTIAIKDPSNFHAIDDLRLLMGFNVKAVVADAEQINRLLRKHYAEDEESIATLVSDMADDDSFSAVADLGTQQASVSVDLDELVAAAEDNRVKRLLNLVLMQGIKDKASDIHFEPFEHEYKLRYRVDGVLHEMIPPPKHLSWAISSRIKVMAGLDIAERRLPQDGRIELMVGGHPVDLRVSVLPTMFGESVVMRVLDRSNVSLELEKVGMRDDDLKAFRQLEHKPNGIVIVTGPTGSGKTTTLYAALNERNTKDVKILTAEDPVEYDIDGLIQTQINENVGLTFARCLRSFLRQDPDIALVGEIRDLETAQIAVQAALTGHLVFSTLHTNDAPSTIMRLLDLGLEAFLVTGTVEGIMAQRLVRRICTKCKEPYSPTEEELFELGLTPEDVQGREFFRGRGCENCHHSGYRGRMGIYEMLILDDELKELIIQNTSTNVLHNEARKRGMRTLRESGLMAIYDGQTTIDEVVRETAMEEED